MEIEVEATTAQVSLTANIFFAWAWLIPVLPLLAFAVITLLPPIGRSRQASATVAILALFVSTLLAWGVLFLGATQGFGPIPVSAGEGETVLGFGGAFRASARWATIGTTDLTMGYRLDAPAALMLAMVTLVSLCIHVFSVGYMAHDEHPAGHQRQSRFFSLIALFTAAMLTTVMADNLLLFFIGWELMGLCSYLLIGFWYFRPSAAEAAKKAFITTRIGDVGLLLGIVFLYNQAGSLTFGTGDGEIFNPAFLERINTAPTALGISAATGIALLLFMGTVGKSAQFPLHIWLPDAMEGPTPVSALIHAATMVAAGVYLVARTYPIFQVSGALPVVTVIGAFTALFAALIAVGQYDIKRILAYSTISQLGFMIAALGLGAWLAALFHLLTNAFFKALLFLGSGSVIHGMEGVVGHDPARAQNIRTMGGLRRHMPWTFWTYMAAYLALAGIFPFAGFWSKDEILLDAWQNTLAVYIVLAIASFLTAFYMTRQVALVFFGTFRGRQQAETAGGHATHSTPHESPLVMVVPLIVLALFAVGGGLANAGLLGIRWLADFTGAESSRPDLMVPLITSAVSFLGIALGWLLYRNAYQSARDPDPLVRALGPLYRALEHKFYLDELYGATIIRLNARLGGAARWLDDRVVDRIVNLAGPVTLFLGYVNFIIDDTMLNDGADMLAKGTNAAGDGARRSQTGHVQDYLALIFVGVVVMAIISVYAL